MLDRTTEYAKLVVSGGRLTGKAERQACERHLRDMADKTSPWIFDAREAERHISVANMLTIGEGQAKPLTTRGFQNFIIGSLFGWRKKRSTLRRFREAYIQMARQNGKSFVAGEMCNDFASFADYQRGKIYCTATKQDQANIVWGECANFIEADAGLDDCHRHHGQGHRPGHEKRGRLPLYLGHHRRIPCAPV